MKKLLIVGSKLKAQVTNNFGSNGELISKQIDGFITLQFESSGNFHDYVDEDGLLDTDKLFIDVLPKLPERIEL